MDVELIQINNLDIQKGQRLLVAITANTKQEAKEALKLALKELDSMDEPIAEIITIREK